MELLRSLADLTSPAPGCVGCWLSEDDHVQQHVSYLEQWQSEEHLYEHIRSELYRRLLAAIELSREKPEVAFCFCSETRGFEVIEQARGQASLTA